MPRRRDEERQGLRAFDLYERFRVEVEEAWHRSELGVWMTENHAELAQMMKAGELDWADAAESFRLAGLRDLRGRFPLAETARETWRRVHQRQREVKRSARRRPLRTS